MNKLKFLALASICCTAAASCEGGCTLRDGPNTRAAIHGEDTASGTSIEIDGPRESVAGNTTTILEVSTKPPKKTDIADSGSGALATTPEATPATTPDETDPPVTSLATSPTPTPPALNPRIAMDSCKQIANLGEKTYDAVNVTSQSSNGVADVIIDETTGNAVFGPGIDSTSIVIPSSRNSIQDGCDIPGAAAPVGTCVRHTIYLADNGAGIPGTDLSFHFRTTAQISAAPIHIEVRGIIRKEWPEENELHELIKALYTGPEVFDPNNPSVREQVGRVIYNAAAEKYHVVAPDGCEEVESISP